MGYIKEPEGVDLIVGPMPFSAEDRQSVSDIIANYKSTGEIPVSTRKSKVVRRKKPTSKPSNTSKSNSSEKKAMVSKVP